MRQRGKEETLRKHSDKTKAKSSESNYAYVMRTTRARVFFENKFHLSKIIYLVTLTLRIMKNIFDRVNTNPEKLEIINEKKKKVESL